MYNYISYNPCTLFHWLLMNVSPRALCRMFGVVIAVMQQLLITLYLVFINGMWYCYLEIIIYKE